ncbi:hypothetical protein M231_04191 [Tremella mesenterica]|uniref:Rho-GAP domain-containing protein n=1 Tax=Tremella mesenterica TaxID=5217 RepID=A0A4Q1BL99_TREME|nr:hypothetical protein M231_04191 [Tremella mesenterica]
MGGLLESRIPRPQGSPRPISPIHFETPPSSTAVRPAIIRPSQSPSILHRSQMLQESQEDHLESQTTGQSPNHPSSQDDHYSRSPTSPTSIFRATNPFVYRGDPIDVMSPSPCTSNSDDPSPKTRSSPTSTLVPVTIPFPTPSVSPSLGPVPGPNHKSCQDTDEGKNEYNSVLDSSSQSPYTPTGPPSHVCGRPSNHTRPGHVSHSTGNRSKPLSPSDEQAGIRSVGRKLPATVIRGLTQPAEDLYGLGRPTGIPTFKNRQVSTPILGSEQTAKHSPPSQHDRRRAGTATPSPKTGPGKSATRRVIPPSRPPTKPSPPFTRPLLGSCSPQSRPSNSSTSSERQQLLPSLPISTHAAPSSTSRGPLLRPDQQLQGPSQIGVPPYNHARVRTLRQLAQVLGITFAAVEAIIDIEMLLAKVKITYASGLLNQAEPDKHHCVSLLSSSSGAKSSLYGPRIRRGPPIPTLRPTAIPVAIKPTSERRNKPPGKSSRKTAGKSSESGHPGMSAWNRALEVKDRFVKSKKTKAVPDKSRPPAFSVTFHQIPLTARLLVLIGDQRYELPVVVVKIIEELQHKRLATPNLLFGGAWAFVGDIINTYNAGPDYGKTWAVEQEGTGDLVGVLRHWIFSLPTPILDETLFGAFNKYCCGPPVRNDFLETLPIDEDQVDPTRLAAARLIFRVLPPLQFSLLVYFLSFFNEVLEVPENLVDLETLCYTYGPSLFAPRDRNIVILNPCPTPEEGFISDEEKYTAPTLMASRHALGWAIQHWHLISKDLYDNVPVPKQFTPSAETKVMNKPMSLRTPRPIKPRLLAPIDLNTRGSSLAAESTINRTPESTKKKTEQETPTCVRSAPITPFMLAPLPSDSPSPLGSADIPRRVSSSRDLRPGSADTFGVRREEGIMKSEMESSSDVTLEVASELDDGEEQAVLMDTESIKETFPRSPSVSFYLLPEIDICDSFTIIESPREIELDTNMEQEFDSPAKSEEDVKQETEQDANKEQCEVTGDSTITTQELEVLTVPEMKPEIPVETLQNKLRQAELDEQLAQLEKRRAELQLQRIKALEEELVEMEQTRIAKGTWRIKKKITTESERDKERERNEQIKDVLKEMRELQKSTQEKTQKMLEKALKL